MNTCVMLINGGKDIFTHTWLVSQFAILFMVFSVHHTSSFCAWSVFARVVFNPWKMKFYLCLTKFLLFSVCGTRGLSVNDFLSGLESSGWLRHIKAVLDAAIFLAKVISIL